MIKILKTSILTLSILSLTSFAEESSHNNLPMATYVQMQQQVALSVAQIKSIEDLDRVISRDSALDLLSYEAKQRFIENITFNEKGVTSFSIRDLEIELTPTQIYQVLALIGFQYETYKFSQARIKTPLDAYLLLQSNKKAPLTNKEIFNVKSNKPQSGLPGGGNGGFLEGYKCASKGTCSSDSSSACTSNC